MFIQDIKQDFYNVIIGKRILIIVNYDIDAICASKILQSIFKYDHMLYSVVPIMGLAGLQRTFNENHKDVKYVILINCGGCIDVVEYLQPDEDITFFICDSHRPFDICNIYSDKQVCLIANPSADENIPPFEAIFRESDDEDEESDADSSTDNENDVEEETGETMDNEAEGQEEGGRGEGGDDGGRNTKEKKRLTRVERFEQRILKQRQRRQWEQERDRLMLDYTQYSYYGRGSALQLFELAWKLSKDSIDLLWWAIVGTTEQLILGKIESSTYTLEINTIQRHVSRLMNATAGITAATSSTASSTNVSSSLPKISFENDLHLVLYRHWSVQESIKYSMYCACKLKLWTLRGEKKLQKLLVEMGLPLEQAKQTFSGMDLVLRKEFFEMIEKLSEKYGIPDIVYGSFTLSYGYRNRFSAADYVYALLAILESIKKDRTPEDCFLDALDSLSRTHNEKLLKGIDDAKQLHAAIFRQVQSSLEMNQIHTAGPFLYYILSEENQFFSYPYGLIFLAKFILHAYVATTRSHSASELPLIASCPIDSERNLCLLVGIPPVREDSPKNFFGKAFEQAAIKSKSIILQDFFETSLLQIKQSDLTKFLDALTVLLS